LNVSSLTSRAIAVDLPNAIYRHLFQIRGPDGLPYRNPAGVKIGHLIGLINEVCVLRGSGLCPIFVFDGETPAFKEEEILRRAAVSTGFKIDSRMEEEMKKTLDLLGAPWTQAPEEAEAQAAHMTSAECWGAMTNDYDCLLFGASRMIRSLSKGKVEVVALSDVLDALGVDHRGLIVMGLLIGTDFNLGGIRGIGPKRALRLVRERHALGEVLSHLGQDAATKTHMAEIEDYYLNPPVTGEWQTSWDKPDGDGAHAYLVEEMGLSPKSVARAVKLAERVPTAGRTVNLP
jgi:flap endonuclease-1